MSSFTYYPNIPNAPDNPSFDQPLMQVNATSINGLIAVDQVSFNKQNPSGGGATPGQGGGQHLQVTFNSKNVPAGTPTDPLSILYTNNIAAPGSFNTASASTVASVFYSNANTIFPVSMVRAIGVFDNNGNSLNTWNIALATVGGHPSAGIYNMTLMTNAVSSNNYTVIVSASTGGTTQGLTSNYSATTTSGFTLNFGASLNSSGSLAPINPSQFSVIVLQL